ncbi:MAG: hypothetical protein ACREPD_13000 [Stenotrophomonas sp.]|uniref:hypothetical protein n=1 Tax=Stenotrophomonas sp. TaxID=69392 RepID=UPI003D6D9034
MPKIQDTCTFRLTGVHGSLTGNTLALAVAIADEAARSDIEIYAQSRWVDGLQFFDCMVDAHRDADWKTRADAIARALRYIEARGDVFPWKLKRHIAQPGWVHFAETDEGHDDTPGPRVLCANCDLPTDCLGSPLCGPCAQQAVGAMSVSLAEARRQLDRSVASFIRGLHDPSTVRAVASAIAREVGHGTAQRCEAQAQAAVLAITGLVQHPAVVVDLGPVAEVLP